MDILKRIFGSRATARPTVDDVSQTPPAPAPVPPRARNNYVVVVLDSCRYDALMAAAPTTLLKLGAVRRCWSYASWTAPAHYNLLMGLLPHASPSHVYASEYYQHDFLKYRERLGADDVEFKSLVPRLYLPSFLKHHLGYRTHALVSLPVLNPATLLNTDFDTFTLMPRHNDMAAMLNRLRARQVRAVAYLDQVFARLFDLVPRHTYVTVTSDHGELFGEGGYFGHGPINHDKVFEVPLIEGLVR